MSRLAPQKLHVRYLSGADPHGPLLPRRYTLTHSDATGDLFLTIGPDYDRAQIAGFYTRLMRDEVLAEWQAAQNAATLHLHCHVSGDLALGPAGVRDAIFRRELPLVLEAFRYGDGALFTSHSELDGAAILVHFHAQQKRYDRVETWGKPGDYVVALAPIEGGS